MKYLCLAYQEEVKRKALPESERSAIESEALAQREDLRQSGHCIGAQDLGPARLAATLRVRRGRASIRPGPFAATREQLSGFYLIEARDLNDAIRVALKMPEARLGCVEVWPIIEQGYE